MSSIKLLDERLVGKSSDPFALSGIPDLQELSQDGPREIRSLREVLNSPEAS